MRQLFLKIVGIVNTKYKSLYERTFLIIVKSTGYEQRILFYFKFINLRSHETGRNNGKLK